MMLVGVDEVFRGAMAVGFMECFSVLEALNEHRDTNVTSIFVCIFFFRCRYFLRSAKQQAT